MRHACLFSVLALAATARGNEIPNPLDQAPSRFAKSGDLKVHYKSLGEGTTAVVFVHGWCCDHTVWRAQAGMFRVRALFVDLPGYGQSDRPKIDYTTDVFADGVDAVLKDAGVKSAVLVGHSMGTPVVRQFYRRYPAKTKGLVFVDGALRPFSRDPAVLQRFADRFREETFKDQSSSFFTGMLATASPAVREQVEAMVKNVDPRVAVNSMRCMMDLKRWEDFEIRAPAQALMAKSPLWTDEYKEYAKKAVPGLDYREFDGVGHFLFMEKPRPFNVALAEFLTRQGVIK